MTLTERIAQPCMPPCFEAEAKADMPGDVLNLSPALKQVAGRAFPSLWAALQQKLRPGCERATIGVFGGSGSGKTGLTALWQQAFAQQGLAALRMSGDNYPHRIPCENDTERVRLFRQAGVDALLDAGVYTDAVRETLLALWQSGLDADPAQTAEHPWLAVYQQGGAARLARYLGTAEELNFDRLNRVLLDFQSGAEAVLMRRFGRTPDALWFERVPASGSSLLLLEWTHAGSSEVRGLDLRVYLHTTPEETKAFRLARGRDPGADSPFVAMVLQLEQAKLNAQAASADLVMLRDGTCMTAAAFAARKGENP